MFWKNQKSLSSTERKNEKPIPVTPRVSACVVPAVVVSSRQRQFEPMKTILTLTAVGVLLLAGCATSYQSTGFTGGYSETKLAPDVVRVVFRGNAYTKKERAQDLALLRAAELSLAAGYPYFMVLSENSETKAHSFTTAGSSHTTGSAHFVGNQAYYSGQTTYQPGQTMTFFKPETGILVRFLKEKQPDVFVFDAAFLLRELKEKYKVQ